MTFEPTNAKQSFLPTSLILPPLEEAEEHNLILTDYLKKVIAALNDKDIAQYSTQELINGQKYFTPSNANRFRFVYRKVIDFGILPNATMKSLPHNISIDSNTVFTRIYATATDPNLRFIPLPYINVTTPSDSVELDVDPTNVNITTTTGNFVGFTTCYIVLEYIKG